uniref:Glycylpeptide N-tetradecanoyltransferase n=1 Tax=Caenorhabditis tropicalis TaxID=1561998 RepID=A0A1I7URW2_9PELO
MESADEIFQFLTAKSTVITSTNEETRKELKADSGGIPTKVIQSCKPSPIGSTMNMSTCSSIDSSDSEEEVVPKKRCVRNVATQIVTDVPKKMPELTRVIPLRPSYSVYLITHNQDNYPTDVEAPEFPQVIQEPYDGLPICLDDIELPLLRTIADAYYENRRRDALGKYVYSDKYKLVWHATPVEGFGDQETQYTVPFTVNKTDFLLRGNSHCVPVDTMCKTLEYALRRGQSFDDLTNFLNENVSIFLQNKILTFFSGSILFNQTFDEAPMAKEQK